MGKFLDWLSQNSIVLMYSGGEISVIFCALEEKITNKKQSEIMDFLQGRTIL